LSEYQFIIDKPDDDCLLTELGMYILNKFGENHEIELHDNMLIFTFNLEPSFLNKYKMENLESTYKLMMDKYDREHEEKGNKLLNQAKEILCDN